MAVYTIQILNNSGVAKSYYAFMEPPVVTTSGGQPVVYSNVWATFNSILSGGYDSIAVTPSAYAYWGTTPDELGPGTRFSSGGSVQVNTATNDSVTFTSGPPTGFSAVTPGPAMTGAFAIVAGTDFTPANGYVFGLAAASQTPIPTPVATFEASPNEVFNIYPVVKFYVGDGAYYPGEVIDTSGVSATLATIDFTGLPQTTATAIQGANGAWTVVYS